MINITIKESVIIVADPDVAPAPGKVTEKIISTNAIEVFQYPHSNQTLLQDNGGMHPDAVTLLPEQLLELIRQSGSHLQPLLDTYVASAHAELQKYEDLLKERLEISTTPELTAILNARLRYSEVLRAKVRGAFYTKQHHLLPALCTYLCASFSMILAKPNASDDQELLKMIDQGKYANRMEQLYMNLGTKP